MPCCWSGTDIRTAVTIANPSSVSLSLSLSLFSVDVAKSPDSSVSPYPAIPLSANITRGFELHIF